MIGVFVEVDGRVCSRTVLTDHPGYVCRGAMFDGRAILMALPYNTRSHSI